MAARKPKVWWFVIPREEIDERHPSEVIDMLRYDHAVPESNAPDGFYLFSTGYHEPTVARWRTFGCHPRSFDHTMWQIDDLPFMADVFARR